ncbi:MAG: hypothetical protein BZ151_07570 [Desulfobacca sp. 4484_104]|nr:MAG: hypothetical protein BZ151_07570 [Desulfobacca sp. 4484_104]
MDHCDQQSLEPGIRIMNDIIHDPNVVPLSGALWLLGLGMLRLMVYQRRKIKKNAVYLSS